MIILTDLYQSTLLRTLPLDAIDFGKVKIERGKLMTNEELDQLTEDYKRFAITKSGISPRAIPGHPKADFMVTSDEHSEDGHVIEDSKRRLEMMEKRMRKLELAKEEIYNLLEG